jgi:hypothetical protein
MASIIRIKRSSVSGNPNTLAAGELAYSALTDNGSNGGDRLYIGIGTETEGNAANHFVIGGKFFTDRLDHTAGTLTASSAVVVDANNKIDVFNVDNLTLDGNTLSSTDTNGNISITPNGTGKTVITNLYIGDTSTSLLEFIQDATGGALAEGEGIDLLYNDEAGTTTISAELASDTNKGIASFDNTDFIVVNGVVELNAESVQDIVGGMVSSNTESGIAVTYDDDNGKLNFDVNDPVITIAGDVDGSATMTNLGNTTINVTLDTVNSNTGSFGSSTAIPVITVNGKGLVTAVTTANISSSFTLAADTGTADTFNNGETLTFAGTDPIDTAVSNNQITISIKDASTTVKGAASFDSGDFSVTSGAVSIKAGGIDNNQLANSSVTFGTTTVALGASSTSIAGVTQLDVDNIRIDGNEISSTNTNGNISLNPNGTGTIAVNSSRITGLAEPVNDSDAATKLYVDEVAQGLQVKPAVRSATDANITATYDNGTLGVGATLTIAATATLTIGGISNWSQFDGILIKNQTNAFENGRYYVSTVGNISTDWVLTRCAKCDEPDEIPSMYIFVQEGTYASTGWVATVEDFPNFDVGIDDIIFTQFSGVGTYLAGDALAFGIDGRTFNVQVAATGGIEISADALQLKSTLAGDGLTYTNGVLDVVGTTNRISVSANAIDISTSYVGQSSITTLGTITTGTWNATTIGTAYGGTGLTSYATGDLIYASATNTLSKLAAGVQGKVLQINSSGVPVWGDVDGGTY